MIKLFSAKTILFSARKYVKDYADWIKSQLPDNIPENIIEQRMRDSGVYIEGLKYYIDGDSGRVPPKLEYVAKDEDDLKRRIFIDVTWGISIEKELLIRKNEEQKWRYIRVKVVNNKWMYRENKNYIYNAIHDTRKYWMEYHLNLIKPVVLKEQLKDKISEYEKKLNIWYKIPHWKFDEEKFEFIEISDSKEFDSEDGIEHPAEDEIIE